MGEPNALIRWAIFVFGSGYSAFLGAFGIAAVALRYLSHDRNPISRPFYAWAVVAIGFALVICGSPPRPIWFCMTTLIWIASVLVIASRRTSRSTLIADDLNSSTKSASSRLWLISPVAWLLAAFATEIPHHYWSASREPITTLVVIGDSVTAGLNDGEDTWPKQVSRAAAIDVLDASQPGATLRSARQQNARVTDRKGTVILEIGGNDMLEGLPVEEFERDLDRLLVDVVQPGRSVVMFELPLPPLCARYGAAQRRQATKHHVRLIPKRCFAAVLTTSGSTVDGIHLSILGQSRMSQLIQNLLAGQFESGKGTYQRFERATN